MLALLWGCGSSSATKTGGEDAGHDTGKVGEGGVDTGTVSDSSPTDTGSADTSADTTVTSDTSTDTSADTSTDTSADTTVVDTSVDTTPTDTSVATFTVGGTISGTNGETVVLQDNGGDNLTLNADGAFTFATPLASGVAFTVAVSQQPTGETCTVMGGMGTVANANVTSVVVTCVVNPTDSGVPETGPTETGTTTFMIGGSITGLTTGTVVLSDGTDLMSSFTANGTFVFPTALANGASYAVTVVTQPTGQTCTVTNGSGTVAGASVGNIAVACGPATAPDGGTITYTIGGTVAGLSAGSVVLQDNGGNNLTVSANGNFTFTTAIASGSTYTVSVLTQPAGLTCTLTNATGTAAANVTNVAVACAAATFTVGGTVSGLPAGASVVLTDNGGNADTVTANGTFTFTTALANGAAYAVAVQTQPTGATCTVSGGTGTISGANVASVVVNCGTGTFTIGGTIGGLAPGDVVELQNNGANSSFFSANGTFAFSTTQATGSAYAVTVQANPSQPVAQTCTVSNGAGTVGSANVNSITITCVTNTYTISGQVNGLNTADTLVLTDNGGNNFTISPGSASPAKFTFTTAIASGATYNVGVLAGNPTGAVSQTCVAQTPPPSSGTVGNANVTGIIIACTTNSYTVGGTVTGLAEGDTINITDSTGTAVVTNPTGAGSVNFTIPGTLTSGSTYTATLGTSPTAPISQTCIISSGGMGTVGNGNVTNVDVTCTTNTYAVTLTVAGLTTSSGTNTVGVTNSDVGLCHTAACDETTNGSFPIGNVASGTAYNYGTTGGTCPAGDTCANTEPNNPTEICIITGAAGTVGAGPVTIAVNCGAAESTISGHTTGLFGALTLNDTGPVVGSANFTIPNAGGVANTAFGPAWTVDDGSNYATSVEAASCTINAPAGATASVCFTGAGSANQTCTIANSSGGPVTGNVTNVNATCTTNNFTVSGTVTGLNANDSFKLELNGVANEVNVTANGTFTFPTSIPSGSGPFGTGSDVYPAGIGQAYNVTFVGGSTNETAGGSSTVNIGPTAVFQTTGTVPQVCTITLPGSTAAYNTSFVGNENVSATEGPQINCENLYTIGGTISGLPNATTSVIFHDSTAADGPTNSNATVNGNYAMPYAAVAATGLPLGYVLTGTAYNISIPNVTCVAAGGAAANNGSSACGVAGTSIPSTCTVTGGTGTVNGANVTTVNATCVANTTCNAILTKLGAGNAPTGDYQIDPTSSDAAGQFYAAYCDNTTSGGGWTLVAKLNGVSTGNWSYNNGRWTTAGSTLGNLATPDTSQADAQYESFSQVPYTNILAGMSSAGAAYPGNTLVLATGAQTSSVAMFNLPTAGIGTAGGNDDGTGDTTTATGSLEFGQGTTVRTDWITMVNPVAGPQLECNLAGVNVEGSEGMPWAATRLGIIFNENSIASDCESPDSYIGFGNGVYTAGCTAGGELNVSVGSFDSDCGADSAYVQAFGFLLVR